MKPVWEKPSEYVRFLRQQRMMEQDHVRALKPTIKAVSDPLASTLLGIIVQDSVSHARLCQLLTDLAVGGVSPEMEVGDIIDMSQAIEEHIQVEEKMIKRLELALAKQLDDKSHLLLSYMLADERRHHNLLNTVMDLIIHKEGSY